MASQSTSQEIDLENVGMHVEASYEKTLRLRVKDLLNCSNENFPGTFPVMLDKEKISLLQEEDYFVCEKSDGVRYMMLSVYTALGPATFLIDRNNTYRYIESFLLPCKDNPGKYHHETLLDGELVINRDRETKQKTLKYLVFDLMVCNSNVIARRPLTSRLGLLRQEIIDPFEQSLLNPDVSKKVPFMINLKRVERSYGMNLILASLSLLDHPSDGLIFTPVSLPYRPGSCSKLLKWKPAECITVDFRIHVTHNSDRKPVYQLQVASGVTNKIFSPLQLPPDIYTKWRNSPPDGKIAEFRWDPSWSVTTTEKGYAPQTVKGGWVFVRLRPDKKVANDETAARSAIKAIEEGVSRELLEEATESMRTRWKERERGHDGSSLPLPAKSETSKPSTENTESKNADDSFEEHKSDGVDGSIKSNHEKQSASSPKYQYMEDDSIGLERKGSISSSPRNSNDILEKENGNSENQKATPIKDSEKKSEASATKPGITNGIKQSSPDKMEVDEVNDNKLPVSLKEPSQADPNGHAFSGDDFRSKSESIIPESVPIVNVLKTEVNHKEDAKRAGSVSILELHTPRKISRRQLSDSNIDIELSNNIPRDTLVSSKNLPESNNTIKPVSQEKNIDLGEDSLNFNNAIKSEIPTPSVKSPTKSRPSINKNDSNQTSDISNISKDNTNTLMPSIGGDVSHKIHDTSSLPNRIESQRQNEYQLHTTLKNVPPELSPGNGQKVYSKIIESAEFIESPTTIKPPIQQPPKRSSNLFSLMSSTNSEPSYSGNDSFTEINKTPITETFSDTQPILENIKSKDPSSGTISQSHPELERPLSLSTPGFVRPSNPIPQPGSGSNSMDLSEITTRHSSTENGSSIPPPEKKSQGKKTSRIADLLNGNSSGSGSTRYESPFNNSSATSVEAPATNATAPLFPPPVEQYNTIHGGFKNTKPIKESSLSSGGETPLQSRTAIAAAASFRHGLEPTEVSTAQRVSELDPSSRTIVPPPVQDSSTINTNNLGRNSSRISERPTFNEQQMQQQMQQQMTSRPSVRPPRGNLRSDATIGQPRTTTMPLPNYSTQSSTISSSQAGAYLFGSMSSMGISRPPIMSQPVAPSQQPILTHQQAQVQAQVQAQAQAQAQASSREASMRRGSNSAHYYRPPFPEPSGSNTSAGIRRSSISQAAWVNGRPEPYPTQSHIHPKYNASTTYPGLPGGGGGRPISNAPGSIVATGGSSNGSGISMFTRPGPQPPHHNQGGHPQQGFPQGHPNHPQGYPLGHPQGYTQGGGLPQGGHLSSHPQAALLQNLPQGFHPNLSQQQPSISSHPQGTLQGQGGHPQIHPSHHGQPMRPKTYTTLPPSQITNPQSYPNLPHSQPFPMGYNQPPQYPYQQQQQPTNPHHQTTAQMYPSRPFQPPQAHSLSSNQNLPQSQKPPSQPSSGQTLGSSIPPTSAPPQPSRQSKGMLDFIMNP